MALIERAFGGTQRRARIIMARRPDTQAELPFVLYCSGHSIPASDAQNERVVLALSHGRRSEPSEAFPRHPARRHTARTGTRPPHPVAGS